MVKKERQNIIIDIISKNENSRIFMDGVFPIDVFTCSWDSGGYDGTESRG